MHLNLIKWIVLVKCLIFAMTHSYTGASSELDWRRDMIREVVYEPEKIKNRVEQALSKYFKEPEVIEVDFFPTRKGALTTGYFSRIDVKVQNAKVKELVIKDGFFSFKGITIKLFDLYRDKNLRLKELEDTQFRFTVSEDSINNAILEKNLPINDARLEILPGHLYFKGYFKTLFFKSHVETKGALVIKNKKHIHFYPDRLKLNSLPIPGFVKRTLSRKINPIIDLDDFDFIKSISEINLQQGIIEFKN